MGCGDEDQLIKTLGGVADKLGDAMEDKHLIRKGPSGESTPVWRVLDWCHEGRQRLRPWVS